MSTKKTTSAGEKTMFICISVVSPYSQPPSREWDAIGCQRLCQSLPLEFYTYVRPIRLSKIVCEVIFEY